MATTKENKDDNKPVKIDHWDNNAVKNTLDDAARKFFCEKGKFKESHCLMDGRLGISAVAVAFALLALVWDYLYPFPESRSVLMLCSCLYFVLMGVLTLYMMYVERGIYMVALEEDPAGLDPPSSWYFTSVHKRFEVEYELSIVRQDGVTGEKNTCSKTYSIAQFFDKTGVLCYDLFAKELKAVAQNLTGSKKTN